MLSLILGLHWSHKTLWPLSQAVAHIYHDFRWNDFLIENRVILLFSLRENRCCYNSIELSLWDCSIQMLQNMFEPQHQKTYLQTCAPSEESRRLIGLFTGRILDSQGCKVFFIRTTKTLIRLRACAVWFESSLGAHVRRYFFSRYGTFY